MAVSVIPSWSETVAVAAGVATRSAAPTNPANKVMLPTDGFPLGGLGAVRIYLYAVAGQKLTGSGSVRIWYYDPAVALWMRNPGLDINITMPGTSPAGGNQQAWVSADIDCRLISSGGTWMLPALDSVAVDGGANVTVSIRAAQTGHQP